MPITLGNNEITGVGSIAGTGSTGLNFNSAGIASFPQRPYTRGSLYGPSGGGTATTYNNVQSRGINFNSGNGHFTVPITGTYLIVWQGICQSESGRRDIQMRINGGVVCETLSPDNGSGYKYRMLTYHYSLSTSDYVTMTGDTWYQAGTSGWASFGMVLIN